MRSSQQKIGRVVGPVLAILLGAAAGVGTFTFAYAQGGSYMTNDPAACANCHVMREHFEAWVKSTHRAVATCNDCHTPHDGLVGKLRTKAVNGFNHSLAFTTGNFHEPIRITPRNRAIVEGACRHCHGEVVQAIDANPSEPVSCVRCHAGVGHAR
jgi:cytochrome c nitrite reductase small subunit